MTDDSMTWFERAASGGDVARQSERRIGEIERLARQVETSKRAARHAKEAALKAGKVSTGWGVFANRDSIDELQKSGTAQAKAIGELADTQTRFFEQHERLAQSVTEFMKLALASKASAQSVYRQLEAKLSGADAATLSELAKQELKAVMIQARQMIDLTEQHEQVVRRLTNDEVAITALIKARRELELLVGEARDRLGVAESNLRDRTEEDEAIRAELGDSDRVHREAIEDLRRDIASLQRRSVLLTIATSVSSAIAVAGLAVALLA